MEPISNDSAGASAEGDDSPKQDVVADLVGVSSNHGVGEAKIDVDVPLDIPDDKESASK
jgi:hypothetical protein